MEEKKINKNKIIEDMQALKVQVIDSIVKTSDVTIDKEKLEEEVTIKYLGKIGLENEKGELVEKDWYAIIEQHSGEYQIIYYDQDKKLLGIQRGITENIIPSGSIMWNVPKEMQKLKADDLEEAKTLEQLEREQNQEKKTTQKPQNEEESQQLPGLQEGPQLTSEQVNSGELEGPKTSLNQIVDGVTLANAIGIQGEYMKLVRADKIREYIPDAEIPSTQRTVPIVISSDGTANLIGEDKLKLSSIEGTNSTDQHTTVTNDGQIRSEQNIETFNIVSKGNMHTIAVGYDENGGRPLEVKYGRRDIDEPTEIAYSELETVHEGPIKNDDEAYEIQKDASEGINQGDKIREDAVKIYTEEMNIVEVGIHGEKLGYDYELGRQLLEERWAEDPDLSLEELIESQQHTTGPRQVQ